MTKSTADKEVKKVTDRIQKTIKKDTDRHKRYLSRTEKANQSKSPVKVHEQVIPVIPSQANSSSGSSTIASNSNNMAAYLGKLSDAEKQALEDDTAKRIAEEVAKVAAGFKVTVTNHAIPTPVYDNTGQVHPNELMEDKIYRAYKSLHPRVRQLVHWNSIDKTQEGLISAANFILDTLHKTQKLEEQGKTKLPPIIATKDKANNSNEQAKSEVTDSSSHSQSSARGQFPNSYRGRGLRSRGTYRGRGYSRGNYHNQGKDRDSQNNGNDLNQQANSQRNGNSNFSSKNAKVDTKIRCFECKGYGHKRDACPKVKGVAMSLHYETREPIECRNCGGLGHRAFQCSSPLLENNDDCSGNE
ncbi:unnamed protein product [Allacma fusca]|uniref:CCHC-type domain-containing protein n=1 Tax=Allacma fusca TaxID=39272 RepID=A0A8J2NQ09_9HEXA|nr:unnamed protein product [Allacma fusca]